MNHDTSREERTEEDPGSRSPSKANSAIPSYEAWQSVVALMECDELYSANWHETKPAIHKNE